eukprot:2016096-Amphidinium_carterae.2
MGNGLLVLNISRELDRTIIDPRLVGSTSAPNDGNMLQMSAFHLRRETAGRRKRDRKSVLWWTPCLAGRHGGSSPFQLCTIRCRVLATKKEDSTNTDIGSRTSFTN